MKEGIQPALPYLIIFMVRIRSAMKEFLVGVARDILEIKKDNGGVAILVMTLNHISEKK